MKSDVISKQARIAAVLGAFVVLVVPLGAAVQIRHGNSAVPIMWAQLLVAPLFGYLALRYSRPFRLALPLAWWIVVPLSVGVVIAPVFTSAAVAFFNFATGVIAGLLIGGVWAASGRRWSPVDWGVVGLTVATSLQIAVSVGFAPSSSAHQFAATPWGRSNYAAGLLVIMVLIVLVRVHETQQHKWLYPIVLAASMSVYLSLSRGALLGAAAGVVVLLWQGSPHPSGRATRFVRWALLTSIPFVAYALIVKVTSTRASVNGQVFQNVETRQALWSVAWQGFTDSPLIGQGWTSLREASSVLVERQSFAHNLVLSFLQQAGLLALPLLCLIAWGLVHMYRRKSVLTAPAAALVMLSVTEPVFEAFLGGMLFWMMLIAHLERSRRAVTPLPRPGAESGVRAQSPLFENSKPPEIAHV